MTGISKYQADELADTWEARTGTEPDAKVREVLRECADTIRMLASVEIEPARCPRAPDLTASMTLVERLRAQLVQDDPVYTRGVTGGRSRELACHITQAADAIETAEKALDSLTRKYAAAWAALDYAHSEGFEWPTDPFGEAAMAFADQTIVPEYAALAKLRDNR